MADLDTRQVHRLLGTLALSRSVLDRADELRSDEIAIGRMWQNPNARLISVVGDKARIVDSGNGLALDLIGTSTLPSLLLGDSYFLGIDRDGNPMFGRGDVAESNAPPSNPTNEWMSLRDVGSRLNARDSEMFATTLGLANWHNTHRKCARCGADTHIERSGWVRRCSADQSEHFPRTDPAVIMLVRDGNDRALLGNRVGWSPQWYSTLAGFVEPGESAEASVAREVQEEVGVVIDRSTVEFLGSQPWPFPSSLMLGFHAYADADAKIVPDGSEIASARWFTRDELRAECQAGTVQIPSTVSIARHLIERWYGAELPGEWTR